MVGSGGATARGSTSATAIGTGCSEASDSSFKDYSLLAVVSLQLEMGRGIYQIFCLISSEEVSETLFEVESELVLSSSPEFVGSLT